MIATLLGRDLADTLQRVRPEVLGRSGALAIWRAFRGDAPAGFLVASTVGSEASSSVLKRLEDAVELSRDLDEERFVRAHAVAACARGLAVVLDDPGGTLLLELARSPSDVVFAAEVIRDVALSLDALHRRGVLHRDVQSANIVVDRVSRRARLLCLGTSARMAARAPARIEGTLAYMAPEQTGSTNRGLDARSDLYALGVVLYELLTGQLPFVARDLPEWVHAHLARVPVPPHERVEAIPRVLSDIAMRLLAKDPEDRYQTARGLAADLTRFCASPGPFDLGRDDISLPLAPFDGATPQPESMPIVVAAEWVRSRTWEAGHAGVEAPLEQLDLATVIKVSEAVSSELSLERLTPKLMTIAIEHAGAERGVLLHMTRQHELHVAAEGTVGDSGVEVTMVASAAYPASLARHVSRSKEVAVLADHAAFEICSADPYFASRTPRWAVCAPLLARGETIAVIYLENHLSSVTFSAARVSVLKLVALQAAAALQNARLYAELEAAKEAIQRSEDQFRTMIDAVPEIAWYNNPDGTNEYQSAVWQEYTGMSPAESAGYGWLEAVHPEDRGALVEIWHELLRTEQPGQGEARVRRHDGVYRWLLFRGRPHRDSEGRIDRWYGNTTDIEDLKRSQAALVAMQDKLAGASRVAALGTLTASITHEVTQPLTAVVANAEAALRWLTKKPANVAEARTAISRIARDVGTSRDVIDRLRNLFAEKPLAKEPVDLSALVDEIAGLARHQASQQRLTLRLELEAPIALVLADRVQMQQVLINLINNAVEAMSDGSREMRELAIATGTFGSEIVVTVSDTGPGFGANDSESIFEQFRTTKHSGMGMGLAICRRIVNEHRGRIWAETNRYGGATLRFAIPIHAIEGQPSPRNAARTPSP